MRDWHYRTEKQNAVMVYPSLYLGSGVTITSQKPKHEPWPLYNPYRSMVSKLTWCEECQKFHETEGITFYDEDSVIRVECLRNKLKQLEEQKKDGKIKLTGNARITVTGGNNGA